ncbi:MAG: hypothetical protein EAY75_07815 [Bacteroidetes bacterium]|nr:MAG: hypothetical protein EAY75_07815 [Bacteroidota bacterium]
MSACAGKCVRLILCGFRLLKCGFVKDAMIRMNVAKATIVFGTKVFVGLFGLNGFSSAGGVLKMDKEIFASAVNKHQRLYH